MKKKRKSPAKKTQTSWQEIRQTASRKVITAYARKRLFGYVFRASVLIVAVAAVGAGVVAGVHYWHDGMKRVSQVLPANPLSDIVLTTDGVLTDDWAWEILALPEGTDMLAIDLRDVKRRVEAHGQVRTALVRRLPDRLLIDVRERYPIARVAVLDDFGEVVVKLVDREGYVYRGMHYERFELAALPYLQVAELTRVGDGYETISGMDRVENLLDAAREYAPHIYTTWSVIDCRDFPNLSVRTTDDREIVFGPDGYREQLRMLDMILASNQRQLVNRQRTVDLSLGGGGVIVR